MQTLAEFGSLRRALYLGCRVHSFLMKKLAAIVALLGAVILFGNAFIDWRNDAFKTAEAIKNDLQSLELEDHAAIQRSSDDFNSRRDIEAAKAVAGAALLITGLALLNPRRSDGLVLSAPDEPGLIWFEKYQPHREWRIKYAERHGG